MLELPYCPEEPIYPKAYPIMDIIKNWNPDDITIPPVHYNSICRIDYKKEYPKLLKWHKYLYNERDINDEGLIYVRHPWESGMDNSPIWDMALNRIQIDEFKYSKYRTDDKKVNSLERPDDITYERYLKLIDLFKE